MWTFLFMCKRSTGRRCRDMQWHLCSIWMCHLLNKTNMPCIPQIWFFKECWSSGVCCAPCEGLDSFQTCSQTQLCACDDDLEQWSLLVYKAAVVYWPEQRQRYVYVQSGVPTETAAQLSALFAMLAVVTIYIANSRSAAGNVSSNMEGMSTRATAFKSLSPHW